MQGPARSDTNTPVDGGGRGCTEACGAETLHPTLSLLHPALPSLCPRPLCSKCLCTITGMSGLVSLMPHSALPISLPGFHFSSQNYQYLSHYIFYYLFAVNSLFRSLVSVCETSRSCSRYLETEGKVREPARKREREKGKCKRRTQGTP